MDKIAKVWFDAGRIYVKLESGTVLNRPLEAYPTLLEATDTERDRYEINRFGDALRWKDLDEDIHISSLRETKEPNRNNAVAQILGRYPWLNLAMLSEAMNIHKSVLSLYIHGMEDPTPERLALLRDTLHSMGHQLITA